MLTVSKNDGLNYFFIVSTHFAAEKFNEVAKSAFNQ